MNAIGLAQTGGNLYAFDSTQRVLEQLNPANAATLATVAVGFSTFDILGEGDIAFDAAGTGFVVSSLLAEGTPGGGSFYSLDLAGNTHTLLKDGLSILFSGLAFNPIDGKMYAMTSDGSALYTISMVDGTLTSVGGTGISNPNAAIGGLSFSSVGTLFAVVGDGSTNSMLYSLDTATGAGTLVGDTGFQAVSGIAFVDSGSGPTGLPEPSTGLLMLSAPLAFAAARRALTSRRGARCGPWPSTARR
jgi:sugar lactone lactonase YvrE